MLYLQKCWQAETTLIWQASDQTRQKFYLILDYRQKKNNIRLTFEKPAEIKPHSNFTSMIRKHLSSCQLTSVIYDDRTDIWMFLKKPSEPDRPYIVRLQKISPPLLSFIDPNGKILCRMSYQQTQTKASQLDVVVPDVKLYVDRLPDIRASLQTPAEVASGSQQAGITHADERKKDLSVEQIDAARRLRRKRKTVLKSFEDAKLKIQQHEKITLLSKQAGALASNLHLIKRGAKDWQGDGQSIELDGKMSPGQNLSVIFKKIKRLQRQQETAQEQISQLEELLKELDTEIQRFNYEPLSAEEIHHVLRHFRIPVKKHVVAKRSLLTMNQPKFRTFRLNPMWSAQVGKSALDNDLLTKQAKSNDYWLHVNAVAGSHIVLKTAKAGLALNETTLRHAAILAVHFSKLSSDLSGEVCYTQKFNLKKPKGFPPGKWNVMHAKNLFVRYTQTELQELLQLEDLG